MSKEQTEDKLEQRTIQQNNALRLYFRHIAKALNEAGYSIEQVLNHYTIELIWTPELVLEILWRTAQKRMLGKTSTKSLLKQGEIDDIVLAISRFLGERLKIDPPAFPSLESLEELNK